MQPSQFTVWSKQAEYLDLANHFIYSKARANKMRVKQNVGQMEQLKNDIL